MTGEGERTVIFCTLANLMHLSRAETWYGDGTFSVVPPQFKQLYTIHCMYLDRIIPAVFCLLSRKNKDAYKTVFGVLRDKMSLHGLAVPQYFNYRADFEIASHSAIAEVFSTVTVECCFFHFSQVFLLIFYTQIDNIEKIDR